MLYKLNMSERDAILLHGKPGSGKTSCVKAALPNTTAASLRVLNHLSVGEHLRDISTKNVDSNLYEEVMANINALRANQPISPLLVNRVVNDYLLESHPGSLTVIDGFPKSLEQVPILKRDVAKLGGSILGIVQVVVSDDTSLNRLVVRGGRKGESTVDSTNAYKRLTDHAKNAQIVTDLLIDEYPYEEISGENSQSSVISDLVLAIDRLALGKAL